MKKVKVDMVVEGFVQVQSIQFGGLYIAVATVVDPAQVAQMLVLEEGGYGTLTGWQ